MKANPQVAPTSLDPYGQLLRMLYPRAHNIAIYDRSGVLLWAAASCEAEDLHQLVHDFLLNTAEPMSAAMHDLNGEHVCALPVYEDGQLLGMVVILCEAQASHGRALESLNSLMRPAIAVLARELASQYNLESMRRDLKARDNDLTLLLGEGAMFDDEHHGDDFHRLLKACVGHLECSLAALLVPEKNIVVYDVAPDMPARAGSGLLSKTHRHLFAIAQVQRRTLSLNHPIATGPLARLGHKVLACPVFNSAQRVVGVLTFFKPDTAPDFVLREIHLVELFARRVAQILLNSFDAASGLLTRTALEHRAAECIKQERRKGAFAEHFVIYVDIDRLHVINDLFGMHVGDEVISRIAAVIREASSPKVMTARISGDRFALFLRDSDIDAATHLAESLCAAVSRLTQLVGGKTHAMSASFGLAPLLSTDANLTHALASAEAACKAAKDRGRGRVEVFAEADHSIIRRVEDVVLVGAIREALDQSGFRMDAQPIVALHSHTGAPRAKFELLLRMKDGQGASVAPDKLFLAAERYQLVTAIDRWVVNHVLELLSAVAPQLQKAGACFAINLSGQSISDDEFVDFLVARLRDSKAPASLISFELTETAAVSNIVRAESMMRKLRELGHEIALDDFGKGLSSLSYLQSLPVSSVKIDGALVRDVTDNETSQAMIRAVVELTRAMKLKTTAECIESEEIHRIVASLGVDEAQGFAIGRPTPVEHVLRALLERPETAISVCQTEPADTDRRPLLNLAM